MRPQSQSFLYLGSCQSPSPLKNTNLFYYAPKSHLEVFWETWVVWRSSQLILKEINPEYSLEGLMLKLKLQYFGHLIAKLTHWKRPWWWERLRAGREGDDRRWDGCKALTQWAWVWANSRRQWRTEKPGVLQSMGSQRAEHDLETEQLQQIPFFLKSLN